MDCAKMLEEKDQTDTSESILESLSSRDMDNSIKYSANRQKINQLETRRVSFPENQEELVTGYLEPADPWASVQSVSSAELASIYKNACRKNNVEPIPIVLRHIRDVELTTPRYPLLRLSGVWLPASACEALEELFRRVQYSRIELAGCGLTDDTAVSMFDMIEYYESTNELDISENVMLGLRGWEACAKMIKNTQSLTTLEARFTPMKEAHVVRLSRGLRENSFLCILKLENCGLSGQGITILVGALKTNYSLKELWIANNELVSTDAIHLSNLLKTNLYLQLLDISNNKIEDSGVAYISEALDLQARLTIQKTQELKSSLSSLVLPRDKEVTISLVDSDKNSMLAPPASRVCIKNNRSPPVSPTSSVSSTQSLDDSPINKQFHKVNLINSGDSIDQYISSESDTPSSTDSSRFDQFDNHLSDLNDTSEQNNQGLSVLILWNNKLTKSSASHICKIIDVNENIEILNIGQNDLSDELILLIKIALKKSTSLLCLGLQSTQLSCEGIAELADVLMANSTLKRLDLRGNFIKLSGLKSLIKTLDTNFSVTQIDLDEKPKRLVGPDLAEYQNLVHRINSGCSRNQSINPNAHGNKTNVISSTHNTDVNNKNRKKEPNRKISLTCQSYKQQQFQNTFEERNRFLEPRNKISGRLRSPLPSPIPSPSSSPIPSPSRHRFHVSKVNEASKIPERSSTPSDSSTVFFPSPTSRFRVTVVESNNNNSAQPKSIKANTHSTIVGFDCKAEEKQNEPAPKENPSNDDIQNFENGEFKKETVKSDKKTLVKLNDVDSSDKNTKELSEKTSQMRNVEISVSFQKALDISINPDDNFYESNSDVREAKISCYSNRHRSMFGSTSSLEASTSSMESISMECTQRAPVLNQTIDLNMSLSSNDSFEIEPNKLSLITNDSLDLAKHHMKISESSMDSSADSSGSGAQCPTACHDNPFPCEEIPNCNNKSAKHQRTTTQSFEKQQENTQKSPEPALSNQNTLTNYGNLSWAKTDDIKKRIRKTSWVPPKLESWIFDEQKLKTDPKVSILKSDSISPNTTRNFPQRTDDRVKVEDCKIPTSLDKLLSIFQHPSGLFMRNTTSNTDCAKINNAKKENQVGNMMLWAKQSDDDKVSKNLLLSTNNEHIGVTDDKKIDLVNDLDNKLNEPLKNNVNNSDSIVSELLENINSEEKLNLDARVIESMKENISPETTIDNNFTSITLSQLIDNVNKQSSTIDNLKGLVESVVNSTDETSKTVFEEKFSNELEHNELNANISIEVQIKTCDTSEIVECVNASEILDNEMKSNYSELNDKFDNDMADNTCFQPQVKSGNKSHSNRNESFENVYECLPEDLVFEEVSSKRISENIIEM